MSETSGGTAPNGFSAGGRSSGSAGSAGIVITFWTAQRSPSRCHIHTDADRSSTLITTPTKPQALAGSWAGPHLEHQLVLVAQVDPLDSLRSDMLQKFRWWPNRRPSRSSGLRPFSNIEGVPHSEVITVSWSRCHQTS